MYENHDVEAIIGNYNEPTGTDVVQLNGYSIGFSLETEDIETGVHSAYISEYGSINNNMQLFMNSDYNIMLTRLANTQIQSDAKAKAGVKLLFNTDGVPGFIRGSYPVLFKYQLPGKNTVTSTYVVNIEH